ncbi:MAG: hypothetical protein IJX81_04890 [Clostridia bacterium]|nr:hypothetical protein [Clostridia bacterium]
MRSFKNYQGEKTKKSEGAEELTKKIASAYDGKSSGEIWLNILSEAEKSKRAGTLSNEEIDAFYTQFSPMLSEGQRKQLKSVVEKLKKI